MSPKVKQIQPTTLSLCGPWSYLITPLDYNTLTINKLAMSKTLTLLLFCTLTLLFSTFRTSNAHDITTILAKYSKFSVFNHHLQTTGLYEEINRGMGLTVCVVDNPTMRHFLNKSRPSTNTLRHILSLHVLQGYYDGRTLRHLPSSKDQVLTLSSESNHFVFGYPRWVHINDLQGGKVVKFSAEDKHNEEKSAYLIRFVKSVPYNISVVQISGILAKPRAELEFDTILTTFMNVVCNTFREKLSGTAAEKIYRDNVETGLTVFCPTDDSFRKFLPKFEELSEKDKNTLLLFHALPIYTTSYMMREATGNYWTLATDVPNRYILDVENDAYGGILLKTKVMETRIAGKLLDDLPMAIYAIDEVLLPQELF